MCIRDSDGLDMTTLAQTLATVDATEARAAHAAKRGRLHHCLLYTSDAADERSSVDLGGRRIIKKKNNDRNCAVTSQYSTTAI